MTRCYRAQREAAARRHGLLVQLGLDPGRLLVIVAFPPDQYAARGDTFEYANFDALVEGWRRTLAPLTKAVNVVVRPHPRLAAERLGTLGQSGCKVVSMPTEELVPLADVYIACISATIRWALALGIPVVNYDCYRYRYDDFNAAPGMVYADNQLAFAAAIQRLCADASFRQGLSDRQMADSGNWGLIDGGFARRFMSLVTALSRPSKVATGVTA